MSVDYPQRDEIENCASAWILRRDRGELTPEDRAALGNWLSADSRHREAYLRLIELWKFAGGLKAWRPVDGQISSEVLGRRADLNRRWPIAIAATLLLTALATFFWHVRAGQEVYVTRVGGYERVLLDDGSVVQLNTNSKVRVRLSDQSREVSLLRGEAYFDIARDARRPFEVMAGGTVVRAVGTAFSIRLRDAERVDVMVTQGRVSVREKKSSPSLLEAGQAAEAKPTGLRVAKMAQPELARRLAWQFGMLHFKNQPLSEVVAEFNRYNARQLEIVDPELATLEVGGSFKANDLESFMAAMRGVRGIRVDESADVIRLSGSAP